MIFFEYYNFNQIKGKLNGIYKSQKKNVVNNIFTADTETTSLYLIEGKWQGFDYTKNPKYYRDNQIQTNAFVYIWQFGVEDVVYYGRYLEDFRTFTDTLISDLKEFYDVEKIDILVWVHNLPYDMCFFNNIFETVDSFQRKPHKQMYAKVDNGITFKDSYIYSNMSLATISKGNKLYKKLSGDEYDYSQIRFPWSQMTRKELEYCQNDILALWEYLTKEMKTYKNQIRSLPMTNTGKVRRSLQKTIKENDYRFIYKCQSLVPTVDIYKDLEQLFMGGVAHSNAIYNGETVKSVKSKDYTSSYPFVMLCEKYPISSFVRWRGEQSKVLNNKNLVWYATLTITNFSCKNAFPYLPKYKEMKSKNCKIDNGRVFKGESFTMLVTNVDYQIIKENYNYKSITLKEIYIARCDYLPNAEREFILDLYVNKTMYKDDSNNIDLYACAKNMFNSLYGMQVTKTVSPDVVFDNETKDFIIEEFNDEYMKKKLEKEKKNNKLCTSFAIGVWVTAYARCNLYECLNHMKPLDVLYTDTDSVKYIEENNGYYDKFFNRLNQRHLDKLRKALPIELFHKCYPCDIHGKSHLIGYLDDEQGYQEFKTFGAKKYAVLQDGKIKITVAGLNKDKGAKKLKSLKDFKKGQVWDYKESGRTTAKYNNNQQPIYIDGHTLNYKCGLVLQPTTYKLGLSREYESFLLDDCTEYIKTNKSGVYRYE